MMYLAVESSNSYQWNQYKLQIIWTAVQNNGTEWCVHLFINTWPRCELHLYVSHIHAIFIKLQVKKLMREV
jgi:hypothetical protein